MDVPFVPFTMSEMSTATLRRCDPVSRIKSPSACICSIVQHFISTLWRVCTEFELSSTFSMYGIVLDGAGIIDEWPFNEKRCTWRRSSRRAKSAGEGVFRGVSR